MKMVRQRRLAAAATLVVLGGAILAGGHTFGLDAPVDIQSVMRSGLPDDTLIYDRTGTVLLADIQQSGTQHTDVPLAAMGRWLPAATVADQDPGFWSEPGVDTGRLARAAWDGVRGQTGETGSSIVLRLIRLPGRHVAAAAGTSEDFSNSWTVGYTPSLAAAVWLGNEYSYLQPVGPDGIVVAAPAWHQFMQAALDQFGKGDEWYAPPPGVREADVNGRPAWFLPGTSPATPPPPLPAGVHVG